MRKLAFALATLFLVGILTGCSSSRKAKGEPVKLALEPNAVQAPNTQDPLQGLPPPPAGPPGGAKGGALLLPPPAR